MAEGSACVQSEDGEVQGDQGVRGEGVVSAEDSMSRMVDYMAKMA